MAAAIAGETPETPAGGESTNGGETSGSQTLRLNPPQPRRVRVEAIASGGEFTLAAAPVGEHRRRRRRRRKRPEGAVAQGGEAVAAAAGGEAGQPQQQQQRRERGPRQRGPRGERREGAPRGDGAPREEQRRDGRNHEGQNRNRDGQRRDGAPRDGAPRDGERRDRGPRQGKGGGKPFGKGGDRGPRDGRRDKPAPKLYSFESVVDRGFEDVAAAPSGEGTGEGESGGETRRIDWTIVKRTVADQRAAKQVSALYILKRDGGETEFPNLGAARAAVNKTIVHPEKLTRPKTDYPNKK